MIRVRGPSRPSLLDALALAPGLVAALLVDVWIGLLAGLASGAACLLARRRLWSERPNSGRLAAALLMPVAALTLASLALDPGGTPLWALLPAAVLLGLVEALSLRRGRSLIRRFPLGSTVALLALAAVIGALLFLPRAAMFDIAELPGRGYDPPRPPIWSAAAEREAMDLVRAIAAGRAPEVTGPAVELSRAESPHGVAVTFYRKDGARVRGMGSGSGSAAGDLERAVNDAETKRPWMPGAKRETAAERAGSWADARIRIDVFGGPRTVPGRRFLHLLSPTQRALERFDLLGGLHSLVYEIEPGVDGLDIRFGDRRATALPEEPLTEGWLTPKVGTRPGKLRRMLRRAWQREHGRPFDIRRFDGAEVRSFRTTGFAELAAGGAIIDLPHGGAPADAHLSRAELVGRLGEAADWLSRQVGPDGRFHYESLPPHTPVTDDYGIARHAGSACALVSFHRRARGIEDLTRQADRALGAALRALDFAGAHLAAPAAERHPSDLCLHGEDGATPSGATALAAAAVALLPSPAEVGDPLLRAHIERLPVDDWLAGLGSCLLQMVDDRGAVFGDYHAAVSRPRVEEERRFFPGEVMLALVHLHGRTGDERYAEAARRIGDRQLALNRASLALDLPVDGDHWFAQAMTELSQATGDARYAELSLLIGRGYLLYQYPAGGGRAGHYRGGFHSPDLPASNSAACRGEALGAAVRAAELLGESTAEIERGLVEVGRFLIGQQFTPQNSYFVPSGFDVTGGLRASPVDNHLRIDNNQHGIQALLAALELLDRERDRRSGAQSLRTRRRQ